MAPWRSLRDASLEDLLHLQRPVCGTQRHFDSSSSSEAGDEARNLPRLRSGRGVGEAEFVPRSLGRSNARLERWSSSSESFGEEEAPEVVAVPAPAAAPVPVPPPAPPFPRPVAPTLVSASVQTLAHSTGADDLAALKESLAALLRSAAAAAAVRVQPPAPQPPALPPPHRVPLQVAQTPVLCREEVVLSRTAQLARALPPPTRTPALPRTHAPADASGLLQSEVVAREFAVWAAQQCTAASPGRVTGFTPPPNSEVDASQMHLDLAALRDMRALLTQHAPRLRS